MSARDVNVALDVWTPEREAKARQAAMAVARAEADLAATVADRDGVVRHLLAEGVPVVRVAESLGLSRERVYQIRDGRR